MLAREFHEATGRWPSAKEIDDIDMELRADVLAFEGLADYLYDTDEAIITHRAKQRRKSRQT